MKESNTMKIKRLFALSLLIAIVGGMWAQPTQTNSDQLRNREDATLPYAENFESNTLGRMSKKECHEMSGVSTLTGHESGHCFLFYTGTTGPQYLISPEFAGDVAVQVSFYHKGFNEEPEESYIESFQIGYSTTTADVDAFAWYNDSISSETWTLYKEYFPIGTKYIAIKCTSENQLGLCLDDFVFSVYEGCPKPTTPTVDVTVNSATLNWTGSNDGYDVKYGRYYYYDFEDGFDGWTTIDADNDGEDWTWSENLDWMPGFNSNNMVYSSSEGLTPDNFLVSPLVPLGGSISFYARGADSWAYEEHFGVAVSDKDNPGAGDFAPIINEWDASYSWTRYTANLTLPTNPNSKDIVVGHVAIRHFGTEDMMNLQVDDITITGPEDTIKGITTTSYVLDNLEPGTYYVQVKGNTRYNEWSPAAYFTIEDYDTFVNDGDWNDDDNWASGSVPEAGTDIIIQADAVIPSNYTAEAGDILVRSEGSLTIQDGGQLKIANQVKGTIQKNITGYGEGNDNGNYYLLASPTNGQISSFTNFQPSAIADIDWYEFNQAADANGNEWINKKVPSGATYMIPGQAEMHRGEGYLYARKEGVTLGFVSSVINNPNTNTSTECYLEPTNETFTVPTNELDYSENADWAGWNLVGNPFTCDAYLNRTYFRMNEAGDAIVEGDGAIKPCEGVFVVVTAENKVVTFSDTPANTTQSLSLNLNGNNGLMDRVSLHFDGSNNIKKFVLNENATKLYIQQGTTDYAVVSSNGEGEMPVSFKASKNGTYTLSINTENVDVNYLHLIDNKTGADVDLLATPSYSFEACTTDYANRFRLVFSANNGSNENETFAYYNGSEWMINNMGEATLQVVDVMGRVLSTEAVNGNATMNLNQMPGVYMLRLVSGDSVKVQKVVVR